jgi:glycosyltransferase involved in cell wall biosynthesis
MSKKVAFYFDNSRISQVDCRDIESGNPGIGGTEYLFLLISTLLTKRDNNIDITVFNTSKGWIPECLKVQIFTSINDAYVYADDHGYDYFVFRPQIGETFEEELKYSSFHGKTKLIPWCHNFLTYKQLSLYSKSDMIARIICVGREQMDLYMDLPAYNKSDYIYNCFDIDEDTIAAVRNNSFSERKNIVTYIGSIVPAKGFHILAKAWPQIEKSVPDAQLYVIGSGQLYDRDAVMGSFNIAENTYESMFMRYLTNGEKINENVHFMGIMGKEKESILLKTKVGVPNPSGNTETFGLTALEFQSNGAKVITKKCAGYMDTVFNGNLYSDEKNIAKLIINALKSKDLDYESFVKKNDAIFSQDMVIKQWEKLFKDGYVLEPADRSFSKIPNKEFRLKWLKYILHKISSIASLESCIPPVDRFVNFIEKCR